MTTRNAASMGTYGSQWTSSGYSGSGNVADLLGSLAGRPAVVAGSADGVFEEVWDATGKLGDPVVFAVNDVGMFLPDIDHWVSLHTDHLGPWKAVRWLQSRGREPKYHGIDQRPFIDYVWEGLTPLFALSGYFAMQIAYLLGCDPIVLCGCPGSAQRRFFEAVPRADFGYGSEMRGSETGTREQLDHEMHRLPDFKSRVRSMSGFTKEMFGGI